MEEVNNNSNTAAQANASKGEVVNAQENNDNSKIPLIVGAIVLVLAGLVYLFIRLGPTVTGEIRDIMLIVYALSTLVAVTALAVLCVNVVKLVLFLKNEINPILKNTDKTVRKLSGTVSFLCDNAVEPTINTASTISGIKNAANGILSIFKK